MFRMKATFSQHNSNIYFFRLHHFVHVAIGGHTELLTNGFGARNFHITNRSQFGVRDLIISKQFSMALGNAPATYQPEMKSCAHLNLEFINKGSGESQGFRVSGMDLLAWGPVVILSIFFNA
jgi:hypothetical protein